MGELKYDMPLLILWVLKELSGFDSLITCYELQFPNWLNKLPEGFLIPFLRWNNCVVCNV